MAAPRGDRQAFGQPGLPPQWAPGDKDGVGTAYSAASRIWYTIWNGIVTEIYYPTVDRPQTRDLQYLFTDGKSFFHDEMKLDTSIERLGDALGYLVRGRDKEGRYSYEKEIISDPHAPCLLQRTKISAEPAGLEKLKLYVLCSPHLNVGGWNNTGEVLTLNGRDLLVAHRDGIWLAMIATVPFSKASVGYVGVSDGWTDLAQDFQMDWQFDRAPDGNIALTGEIDLSQAQEFTLGLAFGEASTVRSPPLPRVSPSHFPKSVRGLLSNGHAPIEHEKPWRSSPVTRGSYITLASNFYSLMKTSCIRERSWLRWPSLGAKPRMIRKEKADIT